MNKFFLSTSLVFAAAAAFATVQIQPTPDKPWRIYRESDTQIKDTYTHNNYSGVEADWAGAADGDENYDDQHWTHYDHTWKFSPGGSGSRQDTDITVDWDGTVYTNATSGVMQWSPVDGIETDTANDGTVTTNLIGLPTFGDEHCIVNDPKNPPAVVYGLDGWDDDIVTNTYSEEYFRYAQTKWHLDTGGKALPQRQNLWQFTGWAKKVLDKRAVPTFGGANMQDITNTAVAIGSIGNLMADGTYWKTLTDGQSLDATPTVSGPDFYAFGVGAQKYTMTILASSSTTNADLSTDTPEFCVGQTVSFVPSWSSGTPSFTNAIYHWHLPSKFVNEPYAYSTYCNSYRQNSDLLTNRTTSVWYVNGTGGACSIGMSLQFANGQTVAVAAAGNFSVYRPQVQFTPSPPFFVTLTNGYMSLGDAADNGAMIFSAKVTSTYSGQANWVQLINRLVIGDWPAYARLNTYGGYWLDNDPFYNTVGDVGTPPLNTEVGPSKTGIVDFSDKPGIDCWSVLLGVVSITDDFKTYLVFHPDGDGIWVTLGRVNWGWHGYAGVDINNGTVELEDSSVTPPTYTDTDEFSVWSSVYSNSR